MNYGLPFISKSLFKYQRLGEHFLLSLLLVDGGTQPSFGASSQIDTVGELSEITWLNGFISKPWKVFCFKLKKNDQP